MASIEEAADIGRLHEWLISNGAKYESVVWPRWAHTSVLYFCYFCLALCVNIHLSPCIIDSHFLDYYHCFLDLYTRTHNSDETKSGSRGAIASADIQTGEYILQIPMKCMMSPPHAYRDPVFGGVLEANKDLLSGDTMLAVYIMIEVKKGADSFYYPYLKVVPKPESVCHWSNAEIDLLQGIYLFTICTVCAYLWFEFPQLDYEYVFTFTN